MVVAFEPLADGVWIALALIGIKCGGMTTPRVMA
jgi:hypothetical protein